VAVVKYSKPENEALGKGAYYLCVSALQKCIRRGDVLRAVNFAKVCWRINQYKLFSRLWTILLEDCGRDVLTLLEFYRYRAGFSTFEPLIPLIVRMCHADKNRDVWAASQIIRGHEKLNQPALEAALVGHPIHCRMIDLHRDWAEKEWYAFSVWDYGVGDANYDWTLELAERSFKWDWSKLGVGLPYFFMVETREAPATNSVAECGGVHLYDGWFPLEALDDHTRQGKICFGTYLKYRAVHFGECREDMGWWVFCQEGWQYANLRSYGFNFPGLVFSNWTLPSGALLSSCYQPEAAEHWHTAVVPELNQVRTWFLDKTCADEMERIKAAYFDQWIGVADLPG